MGLFRTKIKTPPSGPVNQRLLGEATAVRDLVDASLQVARTDGSPKVEIKNLEEASKLANGAVKGIESRVPERVAAAQNLLGIADMQFKSVMRQRRSRGA